jgi:hypothetical protein
MWGATDHEGIPDNLKVLLVKLYIENRTGFEARYESKKSHAKMVGRMKQTCTYWNGVCKVSRKWNLIVPFLV